MGALVSTEYVDLVALQLEAEREECEWLLTSGVLGRSGNLARVLRYVCEEYFQGRADQIKEYTIAVQALGRRAEFDPHTDTIVRVTVHALRKRLLEIYQQEGAGREVRLILPPGHYAPSFIHRNSARPRQEQRQDQRQEQWSEQRQRSPELDEISLPAAASPTQEMEERSPAAGKTVWISLSSRRAWIVAALVVVSLVAAAAIWWKGHVPKTGRLAVVAIPSSGLTLPAPQATIHALMGRGRPAYADHSGVTWADGDYCHSGTSVSLPSQPIDGTEDAPLYLGGVRGIVHCVFPVPQGMYEMRLHLVNPSFPDPSDPPSTRDAIITVNSGPAHFLKVEDEAGGRGIALSMVVTGVARENDGLIHLEYVSDFSLLNAVEILAAPSAQQLPVRIVASSRDFIDDARQVWDSDRYFSGGRHGQELKLANISNLGIYRSSRIGRFRYNIPAVPGAHYRLKLYFHDPWFGKDNGGTGGSGSRIFDVVCNGVMLLKNFDILAEGDSKPVVKTFENVQASADGRIELYFMPIVNYATISAIEILPED